MDKCFICQSTLTGRQKKYCGQQCVERGHLVRANIWALKNREKTQELARIGFARLRDRISHLEDRMNKLEISTKIKSCE